MSERLHFHFSLSCTGEGNGNPLQCSCLENPRDGEAWWAAVYGVAQGQTRLKRLSSSSSRTYYFPLYKLPPSSGSVLLLLPALCSPHCGSECSLQSANLLHCFPFKNSLCSLWPPFRSFLLPSLSLSPQVIS